MFPLSQLTGVLVKKIISSAIALMFASVTFGAVAAEPAAVDKPAPAVKSKHHGHKHPAVKPEAATAGKN